MVIAETCSVPRSPLYPAERYGGGFKQATCSEGHIYSREERGSNV